MHARPVMAMGALATALSAVIIPSNHAGAASSGPAPLAPNLSPQLSLHGIEAVQVAAQQISAATYTVRAGDTLSSIAHKLLGGERYWPELWWANKKITNPDDITVGQVLTLPSYAGSMPANIVTAAYGAIPRPAPPVVTVSDVQQQVSQPQADPPAGPVSPGPVSTAGDSGFQACVISRESGGNPDIWNPSGHWGLYQFDLGTWISGGGSAASFGNASAAEQSNVFWNVFRARGTEPWAPSDGC